MPAVAAPSAIVTHNAIVTHSAIVTDSSAVGVVASALVLAAFGMKDMVNLRIVAICSNVAFITYAVMLNLPPILILHIILLPLNGWRLTQELQSRRMVQRTDLCPPPGHRLNQYAAKLLMRDEARRIAVSPNVNGKENLPLVIPPLNIVNNATRFIDEI